MDDEPTILELYDQSNEANPPQSRQASCPDCGFASGHAANCPTQLETPEQRIARAAHLLECFDSVRACEICEREQISVEEIMAGARRAAEARQQRALDRIAQGDPAYGSPLPHEPESDMERARR